jgi:Na+-transporting methylmalonyl-CoA/oxaloacetate decarboxylase gamma subunit
MIDWNLAIRIAGGGFSLVFLLLFILAFTVWITKLVSNKLGKSELKK